MQRWIMIGGIVVMLGCVGLMGGYMWLKNERANRPDRIWVPILLNAELSHEQHEKFANDLCERLTRDEVLSKISSDMDFRTLGNFSSEDAAVKDLHNRLICEVGEHEYAPSLNIGFRGVRREKAMLRELTSRLMEEFKKIVSPPPPPSDTP